MPFALLPALAAIAGATVLTYLYEREASLWWRLCAGVCVGFALLGLVGFVVASMLGMSWATLVLASVAAGSPLLLLSKRERRARLARDAREAGHDLRAAIVSPVRSGGGTLGFFIASAVVFWLVFSNAMYSDGRGIFTGLDTNIGDMPFHVSLVTGFAYGENFPPEHPEYAGVKLTYPFIVDFITALFVRAGASLEGAFFWQNFLMMSALAGLLHRWALRLTGDRGAAIVTVLLVFLSGGFGWTFFLGEAAEGGRGVLATLSNLPHDYTRMAEHGYSWANAITALFVPQRAILLGLGLALVAWTLWWEEEKGERGEEGKRGKGEDKGAEGRLRSGGAKGAKRRRESSVEEGGKASGKTTGKRAVVRGSVEPTSHHDAGAGGGLSESHLSASSASSFSLFPLFALSPFHPYFRRMIAAGFIVGLLPLVHAHSFVVMMAMGACLAAVECVAASRGRRGVGPSVAAFEDESAAGRRLMRAALPWMLFAGAALIVGLPQGLWAAAGSEVSAARFVGWGFGWDSGNENVVWFWLKNTGVFIPLLAVALLWRGEKAPVTDRLFYFYLPFTLCFVLPNLFRLSPWMWDNIKILLYWWIASAPLVALVLMRLWRAGKWRRAAALALIFVQTFAGGLDVWRAASGATAHMTFDAQGLAFAELIKERTEPRALILHAPTYNDPVYLTGRRTFLGYEGHLWSHGLEYGKRKAELPRIYAGGDEAARLLAANGIDYVVVGPLVRAQMRQTGLRIDEKFFERYEKVGQVGEHRLYKTRP